MCDYNELPNAELHMQTDWSKWRDLKGGGVLVKLRIPIVHSQIYPSENVFPPFDELNYGEEKWKESQTNWCFSKLKQSQEKGGSLQQYLSHSICNVNGEQ